MLIDVAQRLAGAVREDDLVARLGGDEFAVLFVGLSAPAVAEARAHTVLGALATPIDLRQHADQRRGERRRGDRAASTGGMGELLRRADVAMYQAKRDGQRVVAYSHARDTADVGSLTLGGDLARAVAEQQFTVNFQPIVDLGTGEAIAAEALTRWHHPDRGDLTPDRFLDAVERSGPAGRVRRRRARPGAGRRVRVASGRLPDPGGGQRVAAQPARPGLPRRHRAPADGPPAFRPSSWSSSSPSR